ncbi:MAG: SDR family oxidoreductase [Deltaproteobacteria bacterium]|nr:SDR family oxidoreductase [Deltaproteobacteria bacterium]
MSNPFSLEGKVILISGGSGLLGSSLVSAFQEQGGRVIVFDLKEGKSSTVCYYECDVTDAKSIQKAVQKAIKDEERIDVLVNSAYPHNRNWGKIFEEISREDWSENVDGHLGGYFQLTQEVVREMKKQKRGSIIQVGSIYGMVGPDFSIYEGTSMTMPAEYAAIKGGLTTLTRYLATYLARFNIRVNMVSPGGIYSGQPESFVKNYEKRVPLGRMATPEDICGAVLFLSSDAARYITGQNLAVDGGWTAW